MTDSATVCSPQTTSPLPVSKLSDVQFSLEAWLDEVAEAVTQNGWHQQSFLPLASAGLLARLQQEAVSLHQSNGMQTAGIGRGVDHARDRSVRRDKIAWMTGITPSQHELFGLFEKIQAGLNRRLFLGLQRFEAHYATFEPGDFYRRHLDSFRDRRSRVISLVLYLNDHWQTTDGGELLIYSRENSRELCGSFVPEAGQVVVFLSEEVPHEVLQANRTRYSIACWFRADAILGLPL